MEQTITLDEKEIAQIIANSFDCDLKNVEIQSHVTWEGYGPMERSVTRCRAQITITKEGKHTHA